MESGFRSPASPVLRGGTEERDNSIRSALKSVTSEFGMGNLGTVKSGTVALGTVESGSVKAGAESRVPPVWATENRAESRVRWSFAQGGRLAAIRSAISACSLIPFLTHFASLDDGWSRGPSIATSWSL